MSTEFFLTSLIVVLMPGTGVIYTLSHGLGGGARAALAATVGCTLGIVPHMAASIFGLAAVLHASAMAFQAIKFAGVAYLIYLAWTTLKDDGTLSVTENRRHLSTRKIALHGFLINILNPKLSIFFLAFLPQFVPADNPAPLIHMMVLSAMFMALTAVVFAGYGFGAAFMRDAVISRPRVMAWFRRLFAGTFALLGLRLAFAER
ncbi:LysE family translocator [Magnetovibrio sp.]|uniref:LysE family translocator n=1 Tax=Magnetovibrio sp. TaxID=2024836 RepID=UPI002F9257C0